MKDLNELVANGLKHLRKLEQGRTDDFASCRCGALVRVPNADKVDEEDVERGLCDDCDKPLALKASEAMSR